MGHHHTPVLNPLMRSVINLYASDGARKYTLLLCPSDNISQEGKVGDHYLCR